MCLTSIEALFPELAICGGLCFWKQPFVEVPFVKVAISRGAISRGAISLLKCLEDLFRSNSKFISTFQIY
jgi:hypothetical protein